jgi:hypothetical protein
MRAENAAALTNFVLILLIAAGLMIASSSNGAVVYSNPTKAVFQAAALRVLLLAFIAAPLAGFACWRTLVHARRYLKREAAGWWGVLEAGAFGFALPLPFVVPAVVARQFNPGQWGQPQAFTFGLAYVGAYGLIGLGIGLVSGFLLWLSAMAAILVHRRITS